MFSNIISGAWSLNMMWNNWNPYFLDRWHDACPHLTKPTVIKSSWFWNTLQSKQIPEESKTVCTSRPCEYIWGQSISRHISDPSLSTLTLAFQPSRLKSLYLLSLRDSKFPTTLMELQLSGRISEGRTVDLCFKGIPLNISKYFFGTIDQ